ncbi:MAG: right-handed parallel beta-helix repeat-containing protein [Proteobacteria bacterium]|nr:right-handed parallel beta-helix repeat-containing protein [Pseudomonadota bacterium]
MNVSGRTLRRVPLAAALLATGLAQAAPLSVPVPAAWKPGDGRAVAALFSALDAIARSRPAHAAHVAATLPVSSCADDGSAGTLRAVIAGAGEGDRVDASALGCSTITLAQGAIPVMVDDLAIVGAGAGRLAIDGAGRDRVFVHYGYGTLGLYALTVRSGLAAVTGYHVTGGACVISNGYVRLDHSTVSGCLASGEGAYGGGVTARGIFMYTSTLSANVALGSHPNTFTAAYGGGAMAYRGVAYLYASTVSGNRAAHAPTDTHGSYCTGGGIFSDLGGSAYRSTLSGNYSYGTGGGLATHAGFGLGNSTIAGNTARYKTGGGVFARVFDSMLVNNSTIAGNTAGISGAGIYMVGTANALTLQSSIVADNTAAGTKADIAGAGTFTVGGSNNLVTAAASSVGLPADTLPVDPLLLPLGDHGGPTLTLALKPGSPAVDAGSNPGNLAFDQRGAGFPRTSGGFTDIGAFEGSVVLAAPVPSPTLAAWALGLLAGLIGWLGGRRAGSVPRRT